MALIVWIILALIFIVGSTVMMIAKDNDCSALGKIIMITWLIGFIIILMIWG